MSRSRQARSTELQSPTARRSRGLRGLLWLGLAVFLVLGIGTIALVVGRVLDLGNERAETRERYARATEAHQQRLAAVYQQDLAVRTALAHGDAPMGEAYERARQREQDATVAMAAAIRSEELGDPAIALDGAMARWRGALSSTTPGASLAPLEDVAAAHTLVTDELHRRKRVAVERQTSDITTTLAIGVGLVVAGAALAITMVIWVLRRTARPLEELSRLALDGAPFPQPDSSHGVREVDTLSWALHELDLAVRDREERLAAAHNEALDLSRFGEHVQQVVDEAELHEALATRMIADSDAHASVTLVAKGARLEVARSSKGDGDRIQLPILAEPARCRAVRTLKPVTADSASPTACKCALVPDGGSYLCEPMLAAGELVGVVNLQANWKAHFTDRIQRRVHASLGFGATALASIRLLAATRERAFRDPLTGAHNRAFLNEYLNKHLALAERKNVGLGVLAVDLDHFKHLNDTHGHQAGDRALMAVVETLQGAVRASDAVVRHGGEELVVVLVETDLAGATQSAERIRAAIEQLQIDTDQGQVGVRASIGVAAFPEHGHDQGTLLAAADRALYAAKAAGRNRVIAAERRDTVIEPGSTSRPTN
jgi:diguanylate cyclase (GGDEF)-like protein